MKKTYSWGDYSYGKDPQKVGEFIGLLEKRHGQVTATKLVNYAADPKCILHEMFEWDDSEAGCKFRESQARQIIGSLRVTIKELPTQKLRAYVHVREIETENGGYKSISMVMKNPGDWEYVQNKARQELNSLIKKCEQYEQLGQVVKQLELALDKFPETEQRKTA